MLAGIATFVPWVRSSWTAVDDEPAGAITIIPGHDLALLLEHIVQTPAIAGSESVYALVTIAGLWGIPLLLTVLGMMVLVAPRRGRPGNRSRISAGILIASGVVWVVLLTVFSLFSQRFEVISTTNTLQVGPVLALLGYLLALVGLVGLLWLMPTRSRS
jgi:hypothetical protein